MDHALFGRRVGKPLRAYQSHLIATRLPVLALDLSAAVSCDRLFARPLGALRMEIGFGGGEHLVRRATAAPETGFIGCEPFLNGVAKLVVQIEQCALGNVRIHHGDARDVLRRLPTASLDGIDLLYPDPWPKRRQRKRRLVSSETLDLFARCLKPGARWHFATDIDDYAGWVLAHVLDHRAFHWTAARPSDWREPWRDWQSTRYEQKAHREGRDSVYLSFTRAGA